MKKYFILMASAALMFAVSCNKEEVTTPETSNETELITVQINPETKTALGADGATTWLDGDAISVTVDGKNIGTLDLVNAAEGIFSGEVESGYNGNAILNYPAGVTEVPATQTAVAGSFANGAALLQGTTTMDALRAGTGATLSNTTALLQFTVAQAGDVTFEVGTATYTVTGCETGKTYYACVAPATDVTFVARIDGYLSKQASSNVSFAASTIANLATLPAPVESANYGIAGTIQTSQWDAENPIVMYEDIDNIVVLKNVELYKDDEFKVVVNKSWNESYGDGDGNMTVDKNGIFDITFNTSDKTITANCVKEFTDLKVRIYVENQKNWSPLYIHCWVEKGEDDIDLTQWPGATMTKDSEGLYYYEIDGSYIGNQIGYIINNGQEQTDDLFQKLTKDGFTYILPNEVCRLTVKILKSKYDWFNNYIYSWINSEYPTGAWPGTKMSWDKEENGYKIYYFDFPAKYDGQTMNFIINDGSGNQTSDLYIQLSKSGSEYIIK